MMSSLEEMATWEAALRASPKLLAEIKLKSVKHRLGFYSKSFFIHLPNEDSLPMLLGTY